MKPTRLIWMLPLLLAHATASTYTSSRSNSSSSRSSSYSSSSSSSFSKPSASPPKASVTAKPSVPVNAPASKPRVSVPVPEKTLKTDVVKNAVQAPKTVKPNTGLKGVAGPAKPAAKTPKGTASTGASGKTVPPVKPKVVYFSTSPLTGFDYYFHGRYYPHPYSYYQSLGWLSLLDAAEPYVVTPASPAGVAVDPVEDHQEPQQGVFAYDEKRTEFFVQVLASLKPLLILVPLLVLLFLGVNIWIHVGPFWQRKPRVDKKE